MQNRKRENSELKKASELRKRAEAKFKEKPALPAKLAELRTQELIEELRVHQIELEMQNEELRRTQAVVEESRAKYSDLYDFAPIGYLSLDREGIIKEANLTVCCALWIERSLLIKKPFLLFIIKKEERDLFYLYLRKVFETRNLETCEVELKGKNNTRFYAQLESIVVKDNLSQCRTAITDITERKKIEDEVKRLLQVKTQFTSMVSHELRTPLSAIKEGISLVSEGIAGPVNEEQKRFLGIAKGNVDRLARFINEVLDFQALTSGKMEYKLQETDINEVVREVHEVMISLAEEKDLDFLLRLEDDLPKISIDRDKIIQVLTNLVNNALKFTEKGGITITTGRGDNFIQVSVKDTGAGIKKEDFPKLFQQFAQLERRTGGSGLGLAICKEIIEAQRGKTWVESEFGKGSTFHFILPIVERRV